MRVIQKGFTLTELIIVIAVLGVLATIALTVIDPVKQLQRARDTQRKADVSQIRQAVELFRADNDGYPTSSDVTCGGQVKGDDDTVYLQKVPCDPKQHTGYSYVSTSTNTYTVIACLENVDDKDKDPSVNPACSTPASYTKVNP